VRPIAIDDADSIIRTFHLSLEGESNNSEKEAVAEEKPESVDKKSDTVLGGGQAGDIPTVVVEKPQVVQPEVEVQRKTEPIVDISPETSAEAPAVVPGTTETPVVEAATAMTTQVGVPRGEPPIRDDPAEIPVPSTEETVVETTIQVTPAEAPQAEPPVEVLAELEISAAEAPTVDDKLQTSDGMLHLAATPAVGLLVESLVERPATETPTPQTPVEIIVEATTVEALAIGPPAVSAVKEPAEGTTRADALVENPIEIAATTPEEKPSVEVIVPLTAAESLVENSEAGAPTEKSVNVSGS